MDVGQLATTIVTLLGPHIQRLADSAVDGAADRLADAIPSGIRRLYETLRHRLPAGTYGGNQLDGLAEMPDRSSRQQALIAVLGELLEEDDAFAMEVGKLIEADDVVRLRARLDKVEGPVAIGGDVHLEGKFVAGHTLNIRTDADTSGRRG